MRIKKTVHKLIKKYKTTCPYQIAEYRHILIQKEPLGGIYGYFHTYKRIPIIHINCEINEPMQRFICAHELGHAVLHPNVNIPFLKHTFFSVDRLEREANKFAVELLMPDEKLEGYCYSNLSLEEIALAHGIPKEVAQLKSINSDNYFF